MYIYLHVYVYMPPQLRAYRWRVPDRRPSPCVSQAVQLCRGHARNDIIGIIVHALIEFVKNGLIKTGSKIALKFSVSFSGRGREVERRLLMSPHAPASTQRYYPRPLLTAAMPNRAPLRVISAPRQPLTSSFAPGASQERAEDGPARRP